MADEEDDLEEAAPPTEDDHYERALALVDDDVRQKLENFYNPPQEASSGKAPEQYPLPPEE